MIELCGLEKRYGSARALAGLDLVVHPGEWFLYLGPNGAGKSTTMRILMGLSEPSAGSVRVAGLDPRRDGARVRRLVGYLPEDFDPYDHLSGREYLRFVGDLFGLSRAERDERCERLLDLFDLERVADVATRTYSHGMKKRLGLSAALLHDPAILVLDEPTAELDPRGSELVRRVLRGLADKGVCVLMSTHILGSAERQCDRVGILDRGRLVRTGTTDEILAEFPGQTLEEVFLRLTGEIDETKLHGWLGGDGS